jgi:hypothetical protein
MRAQQRLEKGEFIVLKRRKEIYDFGMAEVGGREVVETCCN